MISKRGTTARLRPPALKLHLGIRGLAENVRIPSHGEGV